MGGTVGTRLEANGMENVEANRQKWRTLLFTTEGIGKFISGAILFEETLYQSDPSGKPFVDVLNANGIIPGIKVDTGLKPLLGGVDGEKWCTGLDNLSDRCAKYYEQGARFAKWRTALQIDVEAGCPTDLAIDVASQDLARYARICQENGLVPIVEPEILIDGTHDITTTARIQERVLTTVYAKLQDNGVLLEGSLLKPSMTVPGVECDDKSDPAAIAKMTVQTLDRCLPPAMPGVTFLSGGISEEDSSIYLTRSISSSARAHSHSRFRTRALCSHHARRSGRVRKQTIKPHRISSLRVLRPTQRLRSVNISLARSLLSKNHSSSRTTPTKRGLCHSSRVLVRSQPLALHDCREDCCSGQARGVWQHG